MLTFHQALNKMQEMEEVLVDEYKAYIEVNKVPQVLSRKNMAKSFEIL